MIEVMASALACVVVVMFVVICSLYQDLKNKRCDIERKRHDLERLQTAYLAIAYKLRRVREAMESVR